MGSAMKIISVAAGGSLGAVARYLINISPLSSVLGKFPLATFIVNISGSLMVGFLMVVFADKITVSENVRMAVIVGFLGAFTTFSTFEAEIYGLVRERSITMALGYLFLSVLAGFIGVVMGAALGRQV